MKNLFEPDCGRTQVWSNGAGTQSCALAALIVRGEMPKPDHAYWIDTGRENSDTRPYQERYVWPALGSVGVEVHVVDSVAFRTMDLLDRQGKAILLPGFTDRSGETGKLPQYCTGEWKRDVGKRWLRKAGIGPHDLWIGFSAEELRRVRRLDADPGWERHVYPLIKRGIRREHCILACLEMGWPKPPRSSCWCCPNKNNSEWLEMKERRPADFAEAVALERELREFDRNFFLHESCVPIDQVDFASRTHGFFSSGCSSGQCFV